MCVRTEIHRSVGKGGRGERLAGGGVTGGRVYGRTDNDAAYALDDPVSPQDLAATIYLALGIDPDLRGANAENRPTPIVEGGGPLTTLWS